MDANRKITKMKKVNTKGKYLTLEMSVRLTEAIERHKGFLILIAKEQAEIHYIEQEYHNGQPDGWFADLISAGIYGMCRGALAWQQKEIEGKRTTIFDGELRQAARVRVKQLAKKLRK